MDVLIQLRQLGYFSRTFPYDCQKSQILVKEGCKFLVKNKATGGGWRGMGQITSSCLLALMSQGGTYKPLLTTQTASMTMQLVSFGGQVPQNGFETRERLPEKEVS